MTRRIARAVVAAGFGQTFRGGIAGTIGTRGLLHPALSSRGSK